MDVGGAEKTLVELVCRLDRTAWSPSVVSIRPLGKLAEKLVAAGVPIESLKLTNRLAAPFAIRAWARILRQHRPAILQTFLFHANLLGRLSGRAAGVPRIVSGVRVAERRGRWRHRLDRWTHRLACRHVCVSGAVRDFTAERSHIPPDRLVVIPNGIDGDIASRAARLDLSAHDIRPEHRILIYLGRLDPQKGLFDLLDAIAVARSSNSDVEKQLRVFVVGTGPERDRLECLSAEKSLNEIVRFVGWQPNPYDWLASAHGLVLPSHWEGMPNSVLEAMALCLPVVATRVEGTDELVEPGRTGWLVPPRSPGDLARAILEFLADPERARQYGAAGRDRAATEFTCDRMVRRYTELYESLLA